MREIPTTSKEAAMSEAIKAGDIPHDIQRDVISSASQSAVNALRDSGETDPIKAARQVAEAALEAWSLLNGLSPSSSLAPTERMSP